MKLRDSLSRSAPSLLVFLAPLAVVIGCALWRPASYPFDRILDDGYYYIQIAAHIAGGQGSTFDGVTRTNGYHPLWMGVCALAASFNRGWLTLPLILVLVQAMLAALGVLILERSWRRSFTPTLSVCAALIVGTHLNWAYFNMMESGLLLFFLACLSCVLLREDAPQRLAGKSSIAAGFILLGCCYTRLDMAIIVLGCLVGLFLAWCQSCGWRRALARLIPVVLPLGIGLAVYVGYNLWSFGHAVPISGRVKQYPAFHPGMNSSRIARFMELFADTFTRGRAPLSYLSLWIGLPLCLHLLYKGWKRREGEALLKAGALLGVLTHFAYYALNSVEGLYIWYIVPYALVSVYLLFCCAAIVLGRLKQRSRSPIPVKALVMALALATLAFFCSRVRNEFLRAREAPDVRKTLLTSLLRGLAEKYPSATAAGWNAGLTGYTFEGRLTNLDGLVNDSDYLERYLSRYRTIDYIIEKQFDFIVDSDKFFGFKRKRLSSPAGMTTDAYRRLFELYDLAYVDDFVVFVRKDVSKLYFPQSPRPVTLSDLTW